MRWKILLIVLVLLLPAGCNGPAEEAGEKLDAQVEKIRQETADLKQQMVDYRQQIKEARQELEATRKELEAAKTELVRLQQNREDIITEMQKLEKEKQAARAKQEPGAPVPGAGK